MPKKEKKYGFFTAVCTVVGTVIGSGVFFKAEEISRISGGNIKIGIFAWISGGAVMLVCLSLFARIFFERENGATLTEVAQSLLGESYSYYLSLFTATLYYPSMVSVLSWSAAHYTLLSFGAKNAAGILCFALSCVYLFLSFALNSFFPRASGKIQIITTLIKLIPLGLMIIFGTINGFKTELFAQGFEYAKKSEKTAQMLFGAVVSSAFAYDGWITVTSIGDEIKGGKKSLSAALLTGGTIITAVYVLYYIGISGAVSHEIFRHYGTAVIRIAFDSVLGEKIGRFLVLFAAFSCMGALNGLTMGSARGMYETSKTAGGGFWKAFSRTGGKNEMPYASCVAGFILSFFQLLLYQKTKTRLGFDSAALCVVTMYAMYIPLFYAFMKKQKKNFKNRLAAISAIAACFFMVCAAISASGNDIYRYLPRLSSVLLFGKAIKGR